MTQSDMPLQHSQRQAWRLHSPSYKRPPDYRHSCSLGLMSAAPKYLLRFLAGFCGLHQPARNGASLCHQYLHQLVSSV